MRAAARFDLKRWLFLLLLAGALAQAETRWLTIAGDPEDPAVHTVEVDPAQLRGDSQTRLLHIRVNLPRPAQQLAPTPYRSFEATIRLDCTSNTAQYDALLLYAQPDWKGEPLKAVPPDDEALRTVRFPDADPDPTPRIIKAACLS